MAVVLGMEKLESICIYKMGFKKTISSFQLKSNWAFCGQMLFFLSAACYSGTTPFLKLLHFWSGESLLAPLFPHNRKYHSPVSPWEISRFLALALPCILTNIFILSCVATSLTLCHQHLKSQRYKMCLPFRMCGSTWISYLVSVIINFPVILSRNTGASLYFPHPIFYIFSNI